MKNGNKLNINHFCLLSFANKIYVFGILLFFISTNSYTQVRKNISNQKNQIVERKSFFSNLKNSERNLKSDSTDSKHIENLISKVHSSIYCYSRNVKTYGEEPVCLFTNIQTLPILNDVEIKKDLIEMATLRIENQADLNYTIDLNLFSIFKSLKYIQIISTIPTTEEIITQMIRNDDSKYSVFFKIQNGDAE
ncbi:hypothetical protein [Flavobacterium luteum]|uniref:Uncharacterized protein n=1 Tax=Flavobacterium luteum TaxID=2026654 RepID=A0A7J5A8T3_9FLAO|nr:hypothetical protein [Flavobacterium luteum]KAB1153549.1 hypothetical protein F6464_14220 [Flavobacterium luteum]